MAAARKKVATNKPLTSSKETIYVGVDDEITHIIEKVNESQHKIIALVLPKRAAVLQSIVNMKLLKKAALSNKKHLVLITSEQGLYPLAGAAGIHVARSLQSKPEIPPSPISGHEDEVDTITADNDTPLDKSAPIGKLAAVSDESEEDEGLETIEIDNSITHKAEDAIKKIKKSKRLKVPNFERFRLGVVLAAFGVVLLIVGWFLAVVVLPKATITIKTDTTTVVSSFDFTASANQSEVDLSGRTIPAKLRETKKVEPEKAKATGERDDGTKATGEVTLKLTNCSQATVNIPAGTTVTTNNLNYITQKSVTLQSVEIGGVCNNNAFPNVSTKTVEVVSAENGDKYNQASGRIFTVAGRNNVSGTNEDDITGGTSKIVKIISQKDVDDALSRLSERQNNAVIDELKAGLEADGLLALEETLVSTEPKITIEPEVGKEAEEFTVTYEVSYSMLGVKEEDLAKLVEDDVKEEVDFDKQSITDNGIRNAIMRINNHTTPEQAYISFRTSVVAGPEIDEAAIKEYARGKKLGEIRKHIESIPGVQEADVRYSPFWVYSTPKAAKKISIVIEKLNEKQTDKTSAGNE